jgi:hypothetical protein
MPTSEEGREALVDETRRPSTGEDPARADTVRELTHQPDRPLTDDEEDAAEHDPGRRERVHAPASARVPKEPAPGDDELIEREP